MTPDQQRVARKEAALDGGRFRNRKFCDTHDFPVDRKGKCPECYLAAVEYAEHERDVMWLWNHR